MRTLDEAFNMHGDTVEDVQDPIKQLVQYLSAELTGFVDIRAAQVHALLEPALRAEYDRGFREGLELGGVHKLTEAVEVPVRTEVLSPKQRHHHIVDSFNIHVLMAGRPLDPAQFISDKSLDRTALHDTIAEAAHDALNSNLDDELSVEDERKYRDALKHAHEHRPNMVLAVTDQGLPIPLGKFTQPHNPEEISFWACTDPRRLFFAKGTQRAINVVDDPVLYIAMAVEAFYIPFSI